MDPVIDALLSYMKPESVWLVGEGQSLDYLGNSQTFTSISDVHKYFMNILSNTKIITRETMFRDHDDRRKLCTLIRPSKANKLKQYREKTLPEFVWNLLEKMKTDSNFSYTRLSFNGTCGGCERHDEECEYEITYYYVVVQINIPH